MIVRRMVQSGAAILLPLSLGVGGVPPTWATPADPTAQIQGELHRIADEGPGGAPAPGGPHADHDDNHGDEGGRLAIRVADSTFVPVEGDALVFVTSGSTVRATVEVPTTVVAAARDGRELVGHDGVRHPVDAGDLRETASGAAPPDSDLARATAAQAGATGTDLRASAVDVLAQPRPASHRAVHALTVAVVVPRGVAAPPNTAAAVRAQVAAASSYWSEQTGGALTLRAAAVSSPYTSSFACGTSPFSFWNEAANRLGFRESANSHLVLSFPRAARDRGCAYGLGSIGSGPGAGGVVLISDTAWPVLAHEVGHNFGLGHARALRSTRADVDLRALPNGSTVVDYGDPYDVMAASAPDRAGSLSSVQAAAVGFLGGGSLVDHASGTRSLTLRPLSGHAGVRAVRVTDPATREHYFVEYRTRTGRDRLLYADMPAGVRVLKADAREAGGRASVALDATPTANANDLTWHIEPGAALTTRSGRVSVRVTAQSAAAATVTVAVSPPAGSVRGAAGVPAAPTVTAPAVSSSGSPAARIGFRWSGAPAGWAYDIRYRPVVAGVPGAARPWYHGTARTSGVLSGAYGMTYEVSARARSVGSASPWSAWTTSTIPVDAGARGARLAGAWTSGRGGAYVAGTYVSTTRAGASWTRPPTHARTISVIGPRHARGGRAQVYVDGRLAATADTYAPTVRQRQVLATVSMPAGTHTVRVVNRPHRGRSGLILDAVAYAP